MILTEILRRFFVKYGKIGMTIPSWKGSYEPKVPDVLVQSMFNKDTGAKKK